MEAHQTLVLEQLMLLLLVASFVAMVVQWVKIPYSIALVIVGLVIGTSHLLPSFEMRPDVVLFVFLPALLFEAAWNLPFKELRQNWKIITLLAIPGVLISMVISAFFMQQFAGLGIWMALLFGATLAATDPISVLALFRKLGCDHRLTLLIEGESLFNDGTAVVMFNIIVAALVSGATGVTGGMITQGLLSFCLVVAGGALVGICAGMLGSYATRFSDDHLLEITLTTIVAYGSYLVAEQLHVSPVIAVICAGIVVGNYGSRYAMSATTRLAVNSFWEYAAFLVNSLVFLLIGLQINMTLLLRHSHTIALGIVAIYLARLVVVYGLGLFFGNKPGPVSMSWKHILFWGSLRGSLSMALVLSLPRSLPQREEIIVLTFGCVLFTLIVPGLTVEALVKQLKLICENPSLLKYETLRARLFSESQALVKLEELFKNGSISRKVYEQLFEEGNEKCEILAENMENLHIADSSIETIQKNLATKHLLEVKKDALKGFVKVNGTQPYLIEPLIVELDGQLLGLRKDGEHCQEQVLEQSKPSVQVTEDE
jgi:CPA1 family monovalent cation:H+ antiporter